ncbi:MAG: hypothetical protein IJP92_12620 [Lachnospiraceae bacterium]|nr:hypothetical protein [Lachnospiraceae bacterium]
MKNRFFERKQRRIYRAVGMQLMLLFLLCGCSRSEVKEQTQPYDDLSAEERMESICQGASVSIMVASESDTHVYYIDTAGNRYIRFEPEEKRAAGTPLRRTGFPP